MSDADRTLLVDASVWISLSEVDSVNLLNDLDGYIKLPAAVVKEIKTDPGATTLSTALGKWASSEPILKTTSLHKGVESAVQRAASHLAVDQTEDYAGDVALLALAFREPNPVVISDDKPLRNTCKSLSIPVSGSIGVLLRAVEHGTIEPEDAKSKLYAMDEVGARLSASLVKRAEKLIDDAAD